MSDLVERAALYATQAHARIDQRRKYSNQPYDVHLRAVAEIVSEVTDDEHMIAAAWLHDTVEDTTATVRDIETAFGPDVAALVSDLTDISRASDGNRAVRKAIDRDHTAKASVRAKTIKLADLTDNCRDICQHDPRFGRVYLAEMAALLEVLEEGDERLKKQARKVWARCQEKIGQDPAAVSNSIAAPVRTGFGENFEQGRALRLFTKSFSARDIAEPLASFDAETSAKSVRKILQKNGWSVVGLRDDGLVSGYVHEEDLLSGFCRDHHRSFARGQVLRENASLSDVIHVLTRHESCFVSMVGGVSGIILREHIQKPIVRMWLFGMVTIIEMNLVERIESIFPKDLWREQLSESRLAKALKMQQERTRRGQSSRLLDCLQFSDKAKILINDDSQLQSLGFDSRRTAKNVVKELESLRNNLAHSQDIVAHNWPQIARMTQRIEELILWDGEETV